MQAYRRRIFSIENPAGIRADPSQQETYPQERVMRPTISGLVAAFAVMTVATAPAMACGGYGPCAQSYVPTPGYSGCYGGGLRCGGASAPGRPRGSSAPPHPPPEYSFKSGPAPTPSGHKTPF